MMAAISPFETINVVANSIVIPSLLAPRVNVRDDVSLSKRYARSPAVLASGTLLTNRLIFCVKSTWGTGRGDCIDALFAMDMDLF